MLDDRQSLLAGHGGRIQLPHGYEDIISLENLLGAWREFVRGKRKKRDVQLFQSKLFDEVYLLHDELQRKTYRHGGYQKFNISDPKPRIIHKAGVLDRLLHHAIYRELYPLFDRTFIADSYSCRVDKGTHRAIDRFRAFAYKTSQNNTRTVWVLKCDIHKFFASIDQKILMRIVRQHIPDKNIVWLIKQVVYSFNSGECGKGLPLGNLTSQLLVNIYMNEFDQFVKHKLKVRYYLRYADDFVILSPGRKWLESFIPPIRSFLRSYLALSLNTKKTVIKTLDSGVDFLGWVHFPDHRVLRTTTKRRMFKNIKRHRSQETVQSYLGLLRHGNTNKLKIRVIALVLAM